MDKGQAIHNFWSQFGLPAYEENTVPATAGNQYITYSVQTDSLGSVLNLFGIWILRAGNSYRTRQKKLQKRL